MWAWSWYAHTYAAKNRLLLGTLIVVLVVRAIAQLALHERRFPIELANVIVTAAGSSCCSYASRWRHGTGTGAAAAAATATAAKVVQCV